MARVLPNFDWSKVDEKTYPWDSWMDGQTRRAYKSKDYTIDTLKFIALLKKQGNRFSRKLNYKAEYKPDGSSSVVFQFVKKGPKPKKKAAKKAPKAPTKQSKSVDSVDGDLATTQASVPSSDAPYGFKKDGTPRKKPGRKKRTEQDLIDDLRERISSKESPPVKDPTSGEKQTSGKDSTILANTDEPDKAYSTQSDGYQIRPKD